MRGGGNDRTMTSGILPDPTGTKDREGKGTGISIVLASFLLFCTDFSFRCGTRNLSGFEAS